MFGYGPAIRTLTGNLSFVDVVTYGCVLMLLATLLYDVDGIRSHGFLALFAPSLESSFVFGASGGVPLFYTDRWWTLLSASFLHGGLIHIAFNLYWLRSLIPATEELYGIGRTIIIYTFSSIAGFGLTSMIWSLTQAGLWPAWGPIKGSWLTLGASASLCGLLGALWMNGRLTGRSWMSRQLTQTMVFLVVLGLLIPGMDNLAHIGGFLGGALTARLLKPLEDENIYHLVGALLCLLAFAVSIGVSIWLGIEQRDVFVQVVNTYGGFWR